MAARTVRRGSLLAGVPSGVGGVLHPLAPLFRGTASMRLCAPAPPPSRHGGTLASALWGSDLDPDDRRSGRRATFGFRLLLTPLDEALQPAGPPIHVTGRDLSARGVGFEHDEPITHRKVRLTADDPALSELGFPDLQIDLQLRWCRFVAPGQYESGGRITRTNTPLF